MEIETPEEDHLGETHLEETHQEEDHREEICHEKVHQTGGAQTTTNEEIKSTRERLAVTSISSMEIGAKQRNSKWNLASLK